MAYEQPDNSFSAFVIPENERRENGPLFKGRAKIGGQMFFIDIWENQVRSGDNAGSTYLGGKLKAMTGGSSRGESSRGDSSRGDESGRGATTGSGYGRDGGGRSEYPERGSSMQRRGEGGSRGGGRMSDMIDDDIPF